MCPSNPIVSFLCDLVTLRGVISWSLVASYLFQNYVLLAAGITIVLAVVAQVLGVLIGMLLYFLRRSQVSVVRWIANAYIWLFRGTPLILQITLAYLIFGLSGIGTALDRYFITLYLPFNGYQYQIGIDSIVAALAALALNEGAYMSEIVRAGIDSIDIGQMEAAKSLGMTYAMAMRRVVLPQAARVIVPPLGNEFNGMIKNTSLASAAALAELYYETVTIHANLSQAVPFAMVAAIWYLAMTTVWGWIQARIERRLNASNLEPVLPDKGNWSRLFGFGRGRETVQPAAGVLGDHPR